MARAAKQKAARQGTAAYAASQPLFDALRVGFNRVGEQEANLSIARDIVQNLHVKLPNPGPENGRVKHERYIDCAVKAWQSAAEVYANIFEELATATAAKPSEGRSERDGYEKFAAMARAARDARRVAVDFMLYEGVALADENGATDNVQQETEDDESEDGSDDTSSSGVSESNPYHEEQERSHMDTTPTNPTPVTQGKRPPPQEPPQKQKDEPAKKAQRLNDRFVRPDDKTLNVPYSTLGSSERKQWQAEKQMQKREKKQAKRARERGGPGVAMKPDRRIPPGYVEDSSRPALQQDHTSLSGATASQPTTSRAAAAATERNVPTIQYEDVTAEVEARLQAKEAKKEAMKKEKKRKRESAESVESGGKIEKPEKKRAKSGGDDGVGEVLVKREKRRYEGRDNEEDRGKKKKKKKKTREE